MKEKVEHIERLCVKCVLNRSLEAEEPFTVTVVPMQMCYNTHFTGDENTIELTTNVLLDVRVRRQEQDLKWGENQEHSLLEWVGIVTEEVGEVAKAAMRVHSNVKNPDIFQYRDEMLDVAASAVAAVENLDREGYEKYNPARPPQ